MRNARWVLVGLLVGAWASPAGAQTRTSPSVLGVNPQNLPFKPTDPTLVTVPQDQFSLRKYLSQAFPGLVSPPGPIIPPAPPAPTGATRGNLLFSSPTKNMQVLPTLSGPLQPLPPTTKLPPAVASPFQPLPPTTSLPTPPASPLKPLPPITPGQ